MEEIEKEGRTIAEAVESALRALGLRRDDVEVEVVQEASGGLFGLGSKPARVRVAPKQARSRAVAAPEPKTAAAAPPEDTAAACGRTETLVKELVSLMKLDARASSASWDPVQERVLCSVDGADAPRLVAADGRGLEALQFLVTLMVSRSVGSPVAVQLDAEGYWSRREREIIAQAERGIAEVKASGKPCRLAPMEPAMRRLIHRHFMDHAEIETSSEGEGAWRKIVIRPRKR